MWTRPCGGSDSPPAVLFAGLLLSRGGRGQPHGAFSVHLSGRRLRGAPAQWGGQWPGGRCTRAFPDLTPSHRESNVCAQALNAEAPMPSPSLHAPLSSTEDREDGGTGSWSGRCLADPLWSSLEIQAVHHEILAPKGQQGEREADLVLQTAQCARARTHTRPSWNLTERKPRE